MNPRLTVCGLGPGRPDCVTAATQAAIDAAGVRFLRTSRHPTAHLVAGATSFDHLYDQADTFDQVYRQIAETLVAAARATPDGGVLYAVPGSPLVLEQTVRQLRADDRVELTVLPAVSFLDEAWARLGVDPVDDGVRLVDGHRFAVEAAGERGPLLVAHAHAGWVLSDIKLAIDAGDDMRVVVLQRLGTDDERVFEVGWPDLDRLVEADHLTSLYLPEVASPAAQELAASVALMARLRRDCPWDRAQTHQSLRRYLLEETYEVLEAIDRLPGEPAVGHPAPWPERAAEGPVAVDLGDDDGYDLLEEELGDLWFQILFHAQLASEAGRFTVADVARTVHDKLVGRHPHVFGPGADVEAIVGNWERLKQVEKGRASALDGIPAALPALALADKVLQRADRTGSPADLGSWVEAVEGLVPDDGGQVGLGRLLLAVVEVARRRDLDAEGALRALTAAAIDRFRTAESAQGSPGPDWALG